jgi:hypothetical protein
LAAWHLLPGWLGEGAVLETSLLLSADSGRVLVGLVLVLAATSELFSRMRWTPSDLYYAAGSAGAALISLIGITLPTQGDGGIKAPEVALAVYGIYGVTGLAMNWRWRQPMVTSASLALLLGATLWGLRWLYPEAEKIPLWGSVLAGEALLLGVLAALLGHPRPAPSAFAEPMARTSGVVTLAALGAALWGSLWGDDSAMKWLGDHVITAGCLFALYLLLAALERRAFLARLAGFLLIITAAVSAGWMVTVTEAVEVTAWIALSIAAASTVLAGVAVWAAARETPTAWFRVLTRAWLEPPSWPAFCRCFW